MAFSITDLVIILIIALFTIIGFFKGILVKASKLINLCISGVISFYVATPLSSLFVNLEFYKQMEEVLHEYTSLVFLIMMFIIIFVILFLILNLISKILIKGISRGKLIGFVNRLLGGCMGFFVGFFIATAYLLIFYGLSKASPNIEAFYVSDLQINTELFTFSKAFLNYIMVLFGY